MIIATTVAVLFRLVVLHARGGEIHVNPNEVTHMRAHPPGEEHRAFTEDVECMINLSDGKFVTVIETCETVRKLFEEAER